MIRLKALLLNYTSREVRLYLYRRCFLDFVLSRQMRINSASVCVCVCVCVCVRARVCVGGMYVRASVPVERKNVRNFYILLNKTKFQSYPVCSIIVSGLLQAAHAQVRSCVQFSWRRTLEYRPKQPGDICTSVAAQHAVRRTRRDVATCDDRRLYPSTNDGHIGGHVRARRLPIDAMNERPDGLMDGRTDGRTDRRTD